MKYERITYENHLGKKLEFGDGNGLFVNTSDVRDYEWSYKTTNNRIKSFYKKIKKISIPVYVLAATDDAAIELKNSLMNIAEIDVNELKYGKLWIGDYYLQCYISASKKDKYTINDRYLMTKLTVTTDIPYWTKEVLTAMRDATTVDVGGYDYPYDYAVDYSVSKAISVSNEGYSSCNFRLRVYGSCDEISVKIGDNLYHINYPLGAGEYAVIDSREKIAVAYSAIGKETNIFNLRDRDYYIFEKIPTGLNSIERDTKVDVILYDERSEPLWT